MWRAIVDSLPRDYIRPADVPLLMNYYRFVAKADRLGERLDDPQAVRLLRKVRRVQKCLRNRAAFGNI